jgi:hypothetical protein
MNSRRPRERNKINAIYVLSVIAASALTGAAIPTAPFLMFISTLIETGEKGTAPVVTIPTG